MLMYRNAEGDVLTEEELRERFRDHLDGMHPLIELGDVSFNASRVLEELDPAAFRGQFSAYQDEYGWEEV